MTPRPVLPLNEAGTVSVKLIGNRLHRARCRFRRLDGTTAFLEAEGSSEARARAALDEKIALAKRAHRLEAADLDARSTVLDLIERWYAFAIADAKTTNPVEPRRRPQTLATYRAYIDSTLAPRFRQIGLGEVDTPLIQGFLEDLTRTKPGAIKASRSVLMNAYKWGQRRGVVLDNPVERTSASFEVVRSTPNAARALRMDEIRTIMAAFDAAATSARRNAELAATYRDVLRVLTATGARIGEVLALSVDSYTPGRTARGGKRVTPPTLTISSTLVPRSAAEGGFLRVQDGTKSGKGHRVVTVPEWIDETLRARVDSAKDAGRTLVFTTTAGTAISPSNFRTRLRKTLVAAGLGDAAISPHSWRKTVAEALRDGALGSEGVAQQLGNDVATTEGSYLSRRAHIAPDFAEVLGALDPDAAPAEAPVEPVAPRTRGRRRSADDDQPF